MGAHLQFRASIDAGRHEHGAAARGRGVNRALDRLGVVAGSIAFGSELANVDNGVLNHRRGAHPPLHGQPCSAERGGSRDLPPAGRGFYSVFGHHVSVYV